MSVPELQEHLAMAGVRSSKNNNFLRTKRDMCLALTHASSTALEEKVRQVGAGRKSLDTAFVKAENDLAEVKSAKHKAKDLVRDLQTQRKSLLLVQPVPGATLDATNIANRYRSGAVRTEQHLRSASLQHKEIEDLEKSIQRRQMLLAQLKAGIIQPDTASVMTQIHALALQQEEILEALNEIKVQQHVTRKQLRSESSAKGNEALHKSMTRLSSLKGHLDKQHGALDREIRSRADQVGTHSKDLMEAHGQRKRTLNERLSKLDKDIRQHKTESQDLVQTVEMTKPNTSVDLHPVTKERDMLLSRLQAQQQSLASAEVFLDKLIDRVHRLDIDTQGLNAKISEDPEDLAELLEKIDGVVSNAETLTQEIESTQRALKVQNEQLDSLNQSFVDLLKMTDTKVDIPDGESIDSVTAVQRLKEYITGRKAISQALEDNKEEMATLEDTHQKVLEKLKAIDVVASQVPVADFPKESQVGGTQDQTGVLLALDKLATNVDNLVEQRTRLGQRLASSLEDTRKQLQQQKEQLEQLAADKVANVEQQRNRLSTQLQNADNDAAAIRSELQSVLSRIDTAKENPEELASLKKQMTRVLESSVKTARERDAVQRDLETVSSLKTAIHLQADKSSDRIAQALDTNYMVAQHQTAAMDEAAKLKDQVARTHTRVANGDIAAGQDIDTLANKQQKLENETDAAADIQLAALQSIDKIIEDKKNAVTQLERDIEAITIALKENFEATENQINIEQQQRIQELEQKVKDAEQAGTDPAISKEQLLAAQAEVEQLHAAHRKEFDDQLAVLQTKREEKSKELEDKYAKLLTDKQTELDKEAASIQALHDSRIEKVEADTRRQNAVVNSDGTPNTIQDQLDARNQTLKDTSANMQNEQLLALHQRHERELEDLKRQLREEKQTAERQLQQEHETLDKKLAEAQAELEKQKSSFRELGNRLDIDLTAKQKQVEDVNSVKDKLEKQLADQEARFAETYKQLEQAAIEAKKREEDADKVAKISEVLQLEQQKVSDLRKVALELVDRVEDSETRQAIQQQTLERCRDTIDQLLKTHSELQKQYIALKWEYDTVATVNTAVEQMKEDYQRVKSELLNLQGTFRSIDRAIASLKGKRMFRSKGEKSISSTDTTQAIQDVLEDYSYFRSDYMQIINDLRKNVVGLVETINDKSPTLDIKGLEHRYNVLRMKDPNAAQSYLYEEVLKWYRDAADTKQEVAEAFKNLYTFADDDKSYENAQDEIKMIPHLDGSLEFYKAVHEVWNKFVETVRTTRELKPLFKGLDLVSVFVGDGDAQADRLRGLLMVLVANENLLAAGSFRQLRTVSETGVNLETMVTPNYHTLMGSSWNQLLNNLAQYDQLIMTLRQNSSSGGGQKGGMYEAEKRKVTDLGREIRAKVQSIVDQWVGQKTLRQNIPEHLKALGLGSGTPANQSNTVVPIGSAPNPTFAAAPNATPMTPISSNGPLSAAANNMFERLLAETRNITSAVNRLGNLQQSRPTYSSAAQSGQQPRDWFPANIPQQTGSTYFGVNQPNNFTGQAGVLSQPWSIVQNTRFPQQQPYQQPYQQPNQQPQQQQSSNTEMDSKIVTDISNLLTQQTQMLAKAIFDLGQRNSVENAFDKDDGQKTESILENIAKVQNQLVPQMHLLVNHNVSGEQVTALTTNIEENTALAQKTRELLDEVKSSTDVLEKGQREIRQSLEELASKPDNSAEIKELHKLNATYKIAASQHEKTIAEQQGIIDELQNKLRQSNDAQEKRNIDVEVNLATFLKEHAESAKQQVNNAIDKLQSMLVSSQSELMHWQKQAMQELQSSTDKRLQEIVQNASNEFAGLKHLLNNRNIADDSSAKGLVQQLAEVQSLLTQLRAESHQAQNEAKLARSAADAVAKATANTDSSAGIHDIQLRQESRIDLNTKEAADKDKLANVIEKEYNLAMQVLKVFGDNGNSKLIDTMSLVELKSAIEQLGLKVDNLNNNLPNLIGDLTGKLKATCDDIRRTEKQHLEVQAQLLEKVETLSRNQINTDTALLEAIKRGNLAMNDIPNPVGQKWSSTERPQETPAFPGPGCQAIMAAFHSFFSMLADEHGLTWPSPAVDLPCNESNILELSNSMLRATVQQLTYSRPSNGLRQVLANTPNFYSNPDSKSDALLEQFVNLRNLPKDKIFTEFPKLQNRLIQYCQSAQTGGSKTVIGLDTVYQLAGSLQADRRSLSEALQHQESLLKNFAQAARRARQKKTTQGGGPTFDARTLLDSYDISKINRVVIALNKLIQEKFDSFKKQKDGEIRDVELELDNQEFRKKIDELTQSIQQLSEVATQAANRALTLEDEVYRLQNVTRNMKLFLLGMRDNKDSTYVFYNDLNILRALKRQNQASIFDWSQAVPIVENKTTNVRQVLRWYNGANMDKRISSELVREVLDSLIVLHRDLDNSRIFEEEQERLRNLYQVQSQLREAVSKFNSDEYEQLRADLEDIRQVSKAIQQQATTNDDQLAETKAALNSMLFGNQDQVVHHELLNATFADLVQGLGERVNRLESFADVQVWLSETPYKWQEMFNNAGPLADVGDNEDDRVLVVAFALATAPNNIIRQLLDTQNTLNNSDVVTDVKEIEIAFFRLQRILIELQRMLVGDETASGVLDSIPLRASSHYTKLAYIYELAGAALSILKVGLPVDINANALRSPEDQYESLTSPQQKKLREIRGKMKVYQRVRTTVQDIATQLIDFLSNARGMTIKMEGGNIEEGIPSDLRNDSSLMDQAAANEKSDEIQVSLFDPLSSFFRAWSGLQKQYFSGGGEDVDVDEFIDQMTPEKRDAWLSTAGAKESALKSQLDESSQDEPNETERLLKSKLDQLKLLRRYFEAQRSTEKQMILVEEQKREAEKQSQEALSKLDDPTDGAQQANAFGFLEPIEQKQNMPTGFPVQNRTYPSSEEWPSLNQNIATRYPVQDVQSSGVEMGYPANNEWRLPQNLANGYVEDAQSQNLARGYSNVSNAGLPTLFATVIPEYTDLLNPNTTPYDAMSEQGQTESLPVQQLEEQTAMTQNALNKAQSDLDDLLSRADESDVPILQGLAQKVQEASFQLKTNLPRMLTSAQSGNALASETAYDELDSSRDILSRVRGLQAELALTQELREKLTRIERMIDA